MIKSERAYAFEGSMPQQFAIGCRVPMCCKHACSQWGYLQDLPLPQHCTRKVDVRVAYRPRSMPWTATGGGQEQEAVGRAGRSGEDEGDV